MVSYNVKIILVKNKVHARCDMLSGPGESEGRRSEGRTGTGTQPVGSRRRKGRNPGETSKQHGQREGRGKNGQGELMGKIRNLYYKRLV